MKEVLESVAVLFCVAIANLPDALEAKSKRTRRKPVSLTVQEFLAFWHSRRPASKEQRYKNIMRQLRVDKQQTLPQKGDHHCSYQTIEEGVICTEGTITKCTGNSALPYEVTCTKADNRGYIGKIVVATADKLVERTTKRKNEVTKERQKC